MRIKVSKSLGFSKASEAVQKERVIQNQIGTDKMDTYREYF